MRARVRDATRPIEEIAEDPVRGVLTDHRDERTIWLLAISVSHLDTDATAQLELPLGASRRRTPPWEKSGRGAIARRPGRRCDPKAVRRTGEAMDYGLASRVWRSVPDEFRRLAVREL
jgi:DNA polymerase-4